MYILIGHDLDVDVSSIDSEAGADDLGVGFYREGPFGPPLAVCDLYGFRVVVTERRAFDEVYCAACWLGEEALRQTLGRLVGRAIATKPDVLGRWQEAMHALATR